MGPVSNTNIGCLLVTSHQYINWFSSCRPKLYIRWPTKWQGTENYIFLGEITGHKPFLDSGFWGPRTTCIGYLSLVKAPEKSICHGSAECSPAMRFQTDGVEMKIPYWDIKGMYTPLHLGLFQSGSIIGLALIILYSIKLRDLFSVGSCPRLN